MTTNQKTETHTSMMFLSQLHGLRGVLSLIVVIYHFNIWFSWTDINLYGLSRAVDGFVVLSGYLICRVVMSGKRESGVAFVLNRWIRLFPVYYFSIIAMLVSKSMFEGGGIDKLDVFLHILFLHNFFDVYNWGIDAAFWSLGLEMSLYVSFAVIVALSSRLRVPIIKLLVYSNLFCLLVCVVIRIFAPQYTELYVYRGHLVSRWCQFSCGVWLCLVNGNIISSLKQRFVWITIALACIVCIVTSKVLFLHNFFWSVLLLLSMNLVLHDNLLARILSCKPFQYLGSVSYSTYLIHGTVFYLCTKLVGIVPFDKVPDMGFVVCIAIPLVFITSHMLSIYERYAIRFVKYNLMTKHEVL